MSTATLQAPRLVGAARAPAYFWVQFLTFASLGVMAFGLALLIVPDPLQPLFSLLFFGSSDHVRQFQSGALAYIEFKDGVIGSLALGLGLMLFLIARGPFRRGDADAWNLVAIPIGVWFFTESASSLSTGFAANILLGLVFAVIFAIPLAATYRNFASLE